MKQFLRLLQWTLKAAIFLILLAFALNNKEDVTVHFLWGMEWRAPMVLVLLVVFSLGVALGVLGMVPRWWRERQAVKKNTSPASPAPAPTSEVTDGA